MFPLTRFYKHALLMAAATTLLHVACPPSAAQAQSRFYMPDTLHVSLLRQGDQSGEAMLRLHSTVNISGCAAVRPLRYHTDITNYYLDITVEGYTIDFGATPDNPASCPKGAQFASADIPLDRKLIEDNGIRQIRLSLDRGLGADYYNVVMDADRLELTPRSQKTFKAGTSPVNGQLALSHWYYPENTLILSAPRASTPQDSLTSEFARAHDLIPLEQLLPGFTPPESHSGQSGNTYYVDGNGALTGKIVGSTHTIVGKGIYARHPGLYE